MSGASHDSATCPAFGGCNDCRSAKFEATSPDVVLPAKLTDSQILTTREFAEVDLWTLLEPWTPSRAADPVDYAGVPAFNAAADATLARAGATHTLRGGEYGDTWALENLSTTFLDSVLRDLPNLLLTKAEKRLIVIAALIDVKESRMAAGAWKLDTVDDSINYRAAFATWREEYKEATGV